MKFSTFQIIFLIIPTFGEIHTNKTTTATTIKTTTNHEFKEQENLIKSINEIYNNINATTLIIFNYETKENELWFSLETELIPNLWQKLEQPKLLLHKESSMEMAKYFNSDVLVMVMKREYLNVWDWENFSKTMKQWTRRDVIFIKDFKADEDDNSDHEEEMLDFFRNCWKEGFYNVLLSDFKGEQFFSFNLLPNMKIVNVSVENYLERRMDLRDLQGYRIRTSAGNNPPQSFVYQNEYNEMEYRGVAPLLVRSFAEYYNFSIEWISLTNFESVGMTDCAKILLSDTVDICSEFVPLNDQSYTIAYPMYIVYGYVMVPFAPAIKKSKYLIHPFSPEIWYLIVMGLIFSTLAMSLINRFKLGCWEISSQLIKALKLLLYIAPGLPRHWGLQKFILFFICIPCAFIITNVYLTFLTSILTSNAYEKQINSLEELKRHGIPILITETEMEILSLYNSFEPISDNYLRIDISSYTELRNSLNTNFAYINFEDKCEFYLYQQKFLQRPRLRTIPKPISALWANIPMQDNWPFMNLFNRYLSLMFDTGVVRYLQSQSMEDGIRLGYIQFLRTEKRNVAPVNVEYFEVPAILLFVGYLSAFVCFVIENVVYFGNKIKKLSLIRD
ncbi:uncharacterized protein ACRADG_013183 [Cochliomyia hominivorax]